MKIVDGWIDDAIEIGYAHKSMSRSGYTPKYIVVHGTAGGSSAENIGNYFATSNVQASAHLIIGQDGHIVQGISTNDAAWGNGVLTSGHASYLPDNINPNLYTISIEHVKSSTDNSNALTDIQARKSFELIQCICDTYNIPKRPGDANGGIISHADFDPVNRARCPGPYPWAELYAYLNRGTPVSTPPPPNPNIAQAARDTWNSTAFMFDGTALPYTTGIAMSWRQIYLSGKNMPPPTTREFKSIDWNGNAITVQIFGVIRCEWDASNVPHWYNTSEGIS